VTRSLSQWRRNEFESGAPVRSKGGSTDPAENFFGRAPPVFGSKSTISRFGEHFRGGQYSLVSFLFAVFLLTVPPCPAICKSGGARAPVPHRVGATALSIAPVEPYTEAGRSSNSNSFCQPCFFCCCTDRLELLNNVVNSDNLAI